MTLSCFKAYDVRGRVPEGLNEDIVYRIGRAFAAERRARTVLVGHDGRLESPFLSTALMRGLTAGGADVVDIDLCGTEEVYFGAFYHGVEGSIMVTASHNPKGHNGMKLVGRGAHLLAGTAVCLLSAIVSPAGYLPLLNRSAP